MTQFVVVDVASGAPYGGASDPILFATGASAAEYAKTLSESHGVKYQPRPYCNGHELDAWRDREHARLESGEYKRLLFHNCAWFLQKTYAGESCANHFAHVAARDPSKLAFTESPDKGRADIQTPMRVSAYLQRYYGDVLSPARCDGFAAEHADSFGKPIDVCFATTQNEILAVYMRGPGSCMDSEHFSWDSNPTRVYAAGDLAIAYLPSSDSRPFDSARPQSESFRVSARVICWPERKRFGRFYGSESSVSRLRRALDAQGFSHGGMDGAKLLKIKADGRRCVVMPYIDGAAGVADCGDHLRIDDGGEYDAQGTSGYAYAGSNGVPCCRCDENVDRDSVMCNEDGESFCESCYSETYAYCEFCSSDRHVDSMRPVTIRVGRERDMCESCFDDLGFVCSDCSESFHADMARLSEHDDESRCPDCHETHESEHESDDDDDDSPRETSPTVYQHNQLSFPLTHVGTSGTWRVRCYDKASGLFKAYATFFHLISVQGNDPTSGTYADATRVVAELSAMHHATTRYELEAVT